MTKGRTDKVTHCLKGHICLLGHSLVLELGPKEILSLVLLVMSDRPRSPIELPWTAKKLTHHRWVAATTKATKTHIMLKATILSLILAKWIVHFISIKPHFFPTFSVSHKLIQFELRSCSFLSYVDFESACNSKRWKKYAQNFKRWEKYA